METNKFEYFVSMLDTWRSQQTKRKARIHICCYNRKQADAILKAAKDRKEMKYVHITLKQPKFTAANANDETFIHSFDDMKGEWLKYYTE